MNAPLPPLDIDLIAKNVGKLPSPSAVIIELLRVIDDEEISSTALSRIITRDQSLVVRMLRIANSSFYGMPGKVESVADAIAVLGLRTVRTLAAGAAISGSFGGALAADFELKRFWRHSIATAVSARALARRMLLGEGAAFVAGLVHDIGRLMLACSFPDHSTAVTRHHQAHGGRIAEAEQAVLGMDHARIGGILAGRWHFPPAICQAVAQHHNAELAQATPLAHAVHLANELALIHEFADDAAARLAATQALDWKPSGLSVQHGMDLLETIGQELDHLCDALGN